MEKWPIDPAELNRLSRLLSDINDGYSKFRDETRCVGADGLHARKKEQGRLINVNSQSGVPFAVNVTNLK